MGVVDLVLSRLLQPIVIPMPQNAECVDMFPIPLPRPGYYPATLTDFVACVPPAACPGVEPVGVQAAYTRLLGTGGPDLDNLLQRFYASRPPPGAALVRTEAPAWAPDTRRHASIVHLSPPSPSNHLSLQALGNGSEGTVGVSDVDLRVGAVGFLNVSAHDCAAGEC